MPADEPPHPELFDAHVAHAVLPAVVLYVLPVHAVHVTPLSVLLKPALHVPADDPPQPVLFNAHVAHAVLPAVVLYVLPVHAVHVTPLSVLP